ncbi:MAG: hypothetical protein OXU51_21285 [Candidatus Poribacteria bacterium]|nr:hypothetical protein [Candidatus Poribacteria bacterium]
MKSPDKVSCELRKIEKEIDNCYKSNPLLKLPFATAAWSLLAFGEEDILKKAHSSRRGTQYYAIVANDFINELKDPMYWLYRTCEPEGQVPFAYNAEIYKASWDLFKLGQEYRWFVFVYTGATNGWIELELQGKTIQPKEDFFRGIEYEAYDRLMKPYKSQEALSSVNFDDFPTDAIEHSLRIEGNRFRYKLKPRIVADTITCLKPLFNRMFLLPNEWQFSRYSLGDFRRVFEAISSMAYIRDLAKTIAMSQGCLNMGYADSIYVPSCCELQARVARYSGISAAKVLSVFDDLTYGNRDVKYPDPALQPLIKLNSTCYAIMPHLWLFSAAERNLTVLLNRIPFEKDIYAKLVDEKEDLMRERFTTDLCRSDFRFVCGNITNLPDVDLAIVQDSEKACLLLELKWFIDPAEIREIMEKSEEIKKGVSQVIKLKQAFTENHAPLLAKLNVDSSYKLEGAVVSENWIGYADVQSPKVPVIRVDHLIAKLKTTRSLQSTMEWLTDRKYLPKEGTHFKFIRPTYTIGKWNLKWYGIKPLIKDAFFPL